MHCDDFSAFASSLNSAAPALVSLNLSQMFFEPGEEDKDEAELRQDAAALSDAVRLLLSHLPSLRWLACGSAVARGLMGAPGSEMSGSGDCLYSLTMQVMERSRFPFSAPMSFMQLTELWLDFPMADPQAELLLAACPQLLTLHCGRGESWDVVLIAARCCRRLLQLSVRVGRQQHLIQSFTVAALQPVASPFLPHFLDLHLGDDHGVADSIDFSVLQHFTVPPHAQLRSVALDGSELSAQDVLSLACLPQLSSLLVMRNTARGQDSGIAEVEQAQRQQRQQLSAAGIANREGREMADRDSCWQPYGAKPPLGPQQQREMRQRVMDNIAASTSPTKHTLLGGMEDVTRRWHGLCSLMSCERR